METLFVLVFLLLLLVVVVPGIGFGFLLHRIIPVMELGVGILTDVVAMGFCLHFAGLLLTSAISEGESESELGEILFRPSLDSAGTSSEVRF
jgi:hypothetical protein